MFEFMKELTKTQDGLIMFVLGLIIVAMIIDFLSGTIAAKINPDIKFNSKAGINGLLRKIVSIFLLVFFIPVTVLLPGETGVAILYTTYLGYLAFEIKSIFENAEKLGIDVSGFAIMVKALFKKENSRDD